MDIDEGLHVQLSVPFAAQAQFYGKHLGRQLASSMPSQHLPGSMQAGLKSVMKTASKPRRVLADKDEGSPTPVRVLRNGKKVKATPHLPKASRVELSPSESEETTALSHALRVPLKQVRTMCNPDAQVCCPGLEVSVTHT